MQKQSYDSQLPYLLARANRHVYGRLNAILKEHGIPVEQWRILSVLVGGQGLSMGELAHAVLMNPPALTKAIDRMIVRALVYRRHDANDNRRVLVHISDFGRELVADCHSEVERYEQDLTAPLGPRRTEQLRRLLVSLASGTEPN
jgi:MarR family transcriptional regulator, organic hydroperoxide resistance regulator